MFDAKSAAISLKRIILKIKSDERNSCPLCLAPLLNKKVVYLPCGHCFHYKCMENLKNSACKTKHKCPVCRFQVYERTDSQEKEEIDDFIDMMLMLLELPSVSQLVRTHSNDTTVT